MSLWLTDSAVFGWAPCPQAWVWLGGLTPDWAPSVLGVWTLGTEDTAVTQGQCPCSDGRREGNSPTDEHMSRLCSRPAANVTLGEKPDG